MVMVELVAVALQMEMMVLLGRLALLGHFCLHQAALEEQEVSILVLLFHLVVPVAITVAMELPPPDPPATVAAAVAAAVAAVM